MILNFFKFTSEGNVYVLLDNRDGQAPVTSDRAELLCDFHYGVGGDGVLVLEKGDDASLVMKAFSKNGRINESVEPDVKALCCMARFASVFQEDMMAPLSFESSWGKVRAEFIENLIRITLTNNSSDGGSVSGSEEADYILEGSIEVGE